MTPDETASMAVLANLGRKLVQRLVEDLHKRQVRIAGFECVFHHPDRTMTVERIQFAEPTQDERRFITLLVDRLERIRLSAPVIALSLKAGPADPAIVSHGVLFGDPSGGGSGSEGSSLIERLQARFGLESLYGMDLVDEHLGGCDAGPEGAAPSRRRGRRLGRAGRGRADTGGETADRPAGA